MGDDLDGPAWDNTLPEQDDVLTSGGVRYMKVGLPEAQAETIEQMLEELGISSLGALMEAYADQWERGRAAGIMLVPALIPADSDLLGHARSIGRQRMSRQRKDRR